MILTFNYNQILQSNNNNNRTIYGAGVSCIECLMCACHIGVLYTLYYNY